MTPVSTAAGTDHREARPRLLSPWEHLAALLPVEDLTFQARSGTIPPAVPVTRRAAERRPDTDDV